jgi:excisionase family DNA binding protein
MHTIPGVAKRLNVSAITVRRLVWSGKISAVKVGGQIRIAEEDLTAFLARNPSVPHAVRRGELRRVASKLAIARLVTQNPEFAPLFESRRA